MAFELKFGTPKTEISRPLPGPSCLPRRDNDLIGKDFMGMAIVGLDQLKDGEFLTNEVELGHRPEKPHEEVGGWVLYRYKYLDDERLAMRASETKAKLEAEELFQANKFAWLSDLKRVTIEAKGITEVEYDLMYSKTSEKLWRYGDISLKDFVPIPPSEAVISDEYFVDAIMETTSCPEVCVRSYLLGLDLYIPWSIINPWEQAKIVGERRTVLVNAFLEKIIKRKDNKVGLVDAMRCLTIFSVDPARIEFRREAARAAFEFMANTELLAAGQPVLSGPALNKILEMIIRVWIGLERDDHYRKAPPCSKHDLARRKYIYDHVSQTLLVHTLREAVRSCCHPANFI